MAKKLTLNKSTVADLDKNALNGLKGGIVPTEGPRCKSERTCGYTECCPTQNNCTGGCPRTDTVVNWCPPTYEAGCYSDVCTSNGC